MYTFFGSSLQLAVGPVALVSLLQAELIIKYGIVPGSEDSVNFAGECAVAIGTILLVMSVLNLGNLIRFISHPVMSAFTTAAAMLIGQNQLKAAFGFVVSPPQAGQEGYEWNYQVLKWYIDNWSLNDKTTGHHDIQNFYARRISLSLYFCMLFFVIMKQYVYKPTPERKKTWSFTLWTLFVNLLPLVAIIIGAHLAWEIKSSDHYNDQQYKHHHFYKKKLSIVGIVTPGLDVLRTPKFKWDFGKLLGDVFPTALVLFMESWSVAQRIATQNNQLHLLNASQELWAIGSANCLASICSAYPVAGSFSRSSLNQSAGAKTPLSKVTTMLTIVLTLRFFTRTFQYIPNCALAAVIWVAIFNLVSISDFWHAWKHSKKDFFIMSVTLVTVYVTTTGVGLAAGISCSVLVFLWENAFSDHFSPLVVKNCDDHDSGRVTELKIRQDLNFLTVGRYIDAVTNAMTVQNGSAVAFNDDIAWNVKLKLQIQAVLDRVLRPDLTRGVKVIPTAFIVDLELVRIVDLTALECILDSAQIVRSKKATFTIINASAIIAKSLAKIGFKNDHIHPSIDQMLLEKYNASCGDIIQFKDQSNDGNDCKFVANGDYVPVKTSTEDVVVEAEMVAVNADELTINQV